MDQRANNFDALRLLAALAVLWDHQHPLMGLVEPRLWGNTPGFYAVTVFFAISGYLVTKSWLSDPHLLRFAWRRILRIWPGLIVVVTACALLLGPLVTTLSAADYWRHPDTWRYFHTLHLDVRHALPGVFPNNVNTAVNGSLWTIPLEVQCYVALGLLGIFGLWQYRLVSIAMLAALMAYLSYRYAPGKPSPAWSFDLQYGMVFAVGVAMACWERMWLHRRLVFAVCTALALCALHVLGSPVLRGQVPPLGLAVLAVIVGSASWPVIRRVGRYGDFSYGAYIYAFPVQQTVLWLAANRLPFATALTASTVITLLFGVLSWHSVEKPALRFKPSRRQASPTPMP